MTILMIDTALLREIAVESSCDPRTVGKVIDGGKARGMVDRRIRRVLAARGIEPMQPKEDTR